jgi:hypothetical protein
MWIRNYKGKIVYFDITKYHNEKDLYQDLWKIKYNLIIQAEDNFNQELMSLMKF